MTIRTAPIYTKGDYRVEVRDKSGAVLEALKTTAAWNRMLIFNVTPKDAPPPFRIKISATPEAGVAPGN